MYLVRIKAPIVYDSTHNPCFSIYWYWNSAALISDYQQFSSFDIFGLQVCTHCNVYHVTRLIFHYIPARIPLPHCIGKTDCYSLIWQPTWLLSTNEHGNMMKKRHTSHRWDQEGNAMRASKDQPTYGSLHRNRMTMENWPRRCFSDIGWFVLVLVCPND